MVDAKVFQWFRFNAREFLKDPRYAGLSLEQKGLLISLLCIAWDSHDGCSIPDDRSKISALLSAKISKPAWQAVRAFFEVGSSGMLSHPELATERLHALEVSKKRASAGRLGGLTTQASGEANVQADAQANASNEIKQLLKRTETEQNKKEIINGNGSVFSRDLSGTGADDDLEAAIRRLFPKAKPAWVDEIMRRHGREVIARQVALFPKRPTDEYRKPWAMFRLSIEGNWDPPVTVNRGKLR